MRSSVKTLLAFLATFAALLLLHLKLLRLPYFWDEAGYYIPAAFDFYRSGLLIPKTTLPVGHPPLVIIYLGLAWRLLGYSVWAARAAITLMAAATVTSLYVLGRRLASREIAAWSALLLALSPLFFAQSTLAHLDLSAALFTTLAVLFLLADQFWLFALAASLAVLSKETAVVLLPVVWLYAGRKGRGLVAGRSTLLLTWASLVAPLLPLAAWTLYYHHITGYWTGNREYLSYNLYSTLSPMRVFLSLLRRVYELFFGGFNWLLTGGGAVGFWWGRKGENRNSKFETRNLKQDTISELPSASFDVRDPSPESRVPSPDSEAPLWRHFIFLTGGLIATYLLLLSLVGGAILPRYLLPVLPLFYLIAVALVMRLPRFPARLILGAAAGCFVWAWFINPPYPFPLEDNLAYADFIRLHQQAAQYLEARPGDRRARQAFPGLCAQAVAHRPGSGFRVGGFRARAIGVV